MIVVGIDPAASAGLVALDIAPHRSIETARWIREATISRPDLKGRSHPELDEAFCLRLEHWLNALSPDLIVLEEPFNAADHWNSQRAGGKGKQRRGTSFRLGVAYGLAVVAAGRAQALLKGRMFSYPPTKHENRLGWMGRQRKNQRGLALEEMALLARALRCPAEVLERKEDGTFRREHILMALGVLNYHWTTYLADPLRSRD